ncbi:MAG: hypothetical protein A2Y81_02695 [Nitrospirae bacterium RBG_13_43_8]|nr:MAG: hypothetical protein A2Y81_02695 [Nitrospirae bacterium RBG_13_43_8]
MRRSSKKLPKDVNQLAYEIVRLSTEEGQESKQPPKRSAISEYLSEIGHKGGLKGGPARAKKLSAKKRKEIAKKAAAVRWKKKKA